MNDFRALTLSYRAVAILLLIFTALYGIHAWQAAQDDRLRQLFHLGSFAAKSAESFFDQYAGSEYFLGQTLLLAHPARHPGQADALLSLFKASHPEVAAVNLIDGQGHILASTTAPVPPALRQRSSRLYMDEVRMAMRTPALLIQRPRYGYRTRQWVMPLQYPVRNAQGRLRFVVSVDLLLNVHQAFWRALILPAGTSIGLLRADGYLQNRWPDPADVRASYDSPYAGPLAAALRTHPGRARGFYVERGRFGQNTRIGAYDRLPHYPFIAFISIPIHLVWSDWARRVIFPFTLLLLLSLAGTLVFRKALRLQNILERERRASQDKIQRLNAELEQRVVERTTELMAVNQELESFCYSVSHDLRSPLRAIDGFSFALLEDYSLDAQGRAYLERVRAASQRMAKLMDDLLELTRITRQELHPGPVDLSAVAGRIAQSLGGGDPERRVRFHIAPGIQAHGDPELLSRVLESLMDNAWKFTAPKAEAQITFDMLEQAGECAYFVRDNGVGFDMRFADKLFGPFQRLHGIEEFSGTGIGLVTVQRIVHRHGGRVWAEGEPGRGATFYFTLGVSSARDTLRGVG